MVETIICLLATILIDGQWLILETQDERRRCEGNGIGEEVWH
jgi:hypothetical protein